ncbi:unnamed protein product [Rhizophagus irregularis]|nr:unnamed protein product [Rhizophagus irregularis]
MKEKLPQTNSLKFSLLINYPKFESYFNTIFCVNNRKIIFINNCYINDQLSINKQRVILMDKRRQTSGRNTNSLRLETVDYRIDESDLGC